MKTKITGAIAVLIAEQAAILIESGADTARLQTFVEELVANNDYIAYAVLENVKELSSLSNELKDSLMIFKINADAEANA